MAQHIKRVLGFAFTDFYRHRGMSLAAIFILTITVLTITGLFFLQATSDFLIDTVRNKIDVTAYFHATTEEQDILNIRQDIINVSPNVTNVEYVSKEEARAEFLEIHKDDPDLAEALESLGENPFLPSLNITTNGGTSQYESISQVLESEQYSSFIESVDFDEKKETIETIFQATSSAKALGWGIGIVLILVVIMVVFNTIKLIIENSKDEIATMKIVGASSWFVRAPFIIQGALFGVISFVICIILTSVAVYFIAPGLAAATGGFNIFHYFLANVWLVILLQLATGVGLGVLASFIVVRRYLKV